ncbi:MAG TPA: MFS transporter [Nevskiaceae bacterium]|nr:MFS transporter [Nevskiaceae bacterium]
MKEKFSTLGGAQAWCIWGLCVVFLVWLFNLQTSYAVLSPKIENELMLTIAQIGLVSSVYTWAFAAIQFISGPLLDRFGLRKCMPWAVAFVVLGAFLYSSAHSIEALLVAQILLALGAAFGFVGAGFAGDKWFGAAKYGVMFGLVQAGASLGSTVGTPTINYFANLYDWRSVLFIFFLFGIALFVAFLVWVRDPKTGDTPKTFKLSLPKQVVTELRACFKLPNVWLSALIAGTSFGIMLAVGVLWGPRIISAHGFESGALATALLWLGLAIGAPLFNVISNKLKNRKLTLAAGILLQAAVTAMLVFTPSLTESVLLWLMFLLGLTSGAHMLGFTIAGETVAGNLIGGASAIVNATCFIIGGIAMSFPAHLLPSHTPSLADFSHALLIMPIGLAIAFLLSLIVRETYKVPKVVP